MSDCIGQKFILNQWMKIMKDLSIIIITWNALEHLKKCLDSVFKTVKEIDYEIIVVDNNSKDNTLDYVKHFSKIKIIANNENRGVAAGRNQGIKIAQGKYILILDVDAELTSSAVENLVRFFDKNEKAGLVGPKLTYSDGSLQYSCRKFPNVLTKILRRVPFADKLLKEEQMRDWDHSGVKDVDYVIGACQLIRKKAIDEVGILDENIFYGPEDVDFCLRLWRGNWQVYYNPEAVVIHHEQRITKNKFFTKMTYLHIKGLIYYFWKHKYLFDIDRRSRTEDRKL